MSQQDKDKSWEEYILNSLTIYTMVHVPQTSEFSFIGLSLKEARAIAKKNELDLKHLEVRINDLPVMFQFRKKERS